MSSNPAEPENYSLDEMMDRLQKRDATPEDSGQLVTRADGTQAIKVRKRKRRSSQPHKEAAKRASRLRAIQLSSAFVLLVLLVLAGGALIVYVNSPGYRQGVVAKIDTASGGKVSLQQFRVNPTGSNTAVADFEWPDGNVLESLHLNSIRTKSLVTSLIGKTWAAGDISALQGSLQLKQPKAGAPLRFQPTSSEGLPVSFERLGVAKMDITVGNANPPALKLQQSEASFYPKSASGDSTLRLARGTLIIPSWPVLQLDRALLEFRGPEVVVSNAKILHELDTIGHIDLSGTFNAETMGTEQSLAVSMESFSLNGIAGQSLGLLLNGRVDSIDARSTNQLTFSSDDPTGRLSVALSSSANSSPRMTRFAFLPILAKILTNHWYNEPVFEDGMTCTLVREKGQVRLTELSLTSKTQLRITGDLSAGKDESLSGTLRVGLPDASLIAAGNEKLKRTFAESSEGFRWVTIRISGTTDRPTDNFAALYEGAPDTATGTNTPSTFEQLTAPK